MTQNSYNEVMDGLDRVGHMFGWNCDLGIRAKEMQTIVNKCVAIRSPRGLELPGSDGLIVVRPPGGGQRTDNRGY
jgi:hypothetical protein